MIRVAERGHCQDRWSCRGNFRLLAEGWIKVVPSHAEQRLWLSHKVLFGGGVHMVRHGKELGYGADVASSLFAIYVYLCVRGY